MNNCGFADKIEAYHDAELNPAQRSAMEKHVAECPACLASLHQLQTLSAFLASSDQPRLSQISRHRLHRAVDAAMERGLLRFAWSMSAVAACVLLVGSAWLVKVNDAAQAQVPTEAPPWVAVSLASNRDPLVRDAVSPAAQFYLADASGNEGIDNR